MAVLRQLSRYASRATIKNIAAATIVSKIHYNISLVGPLPDYLAAKIQTIILQAAKVVLGSTANRQSTSTILRMTGCLEYRQYYKYFTAKIALRASNSKVPATLAAIIPTIGTQVTRAQQRGQLQ